MNKFLLICLIGLSGCETMPIYQLLQGVQPPTSYEDGCSDNRIAHNSWTISFQGNRNTNIEFIKNCAYYRCAEICKSNGYVYFQIIEAIDLSYSTSYVNNGSGTINTFGGSSIYEDRPATITKINHPGISYTIECYLYNNAPKDRKTYDSFDILTYMQHP